MNRDFRPKFFEPEDTVFLGFFALWAALGIVVSIAVMTTGASAEEED